MYRKSRVVLRAISGAIPNSRSVSCALDEELLYLLSSQALAFLCEGWEWLYPDPEQHCLRTDWGLTASNLIQYLLLGMYRSREDFRCHFRDFKMCKPCVALAKVPQETYPVRFLEDAVDEKCWGGRANDAQEMKRLSRCSVDRTF